MLALDASKKKLYKISKYKDQAGIKFTQSSLTASSNPVALAVNQEIKTVFWSDVLLHKVSRLGLESCAIKFYKITFKPKISAIKCFPVTNKFLRPGNRLTL